MGRQERTVHRLPDPGYWREVRSNPRKLKGYFSFQFTRGPSSGRRGGLSGPGASRDRLPALRRAVGDALPLLLLAPVPAGPVFRGAPGPALLSVPDAPVDAVGARFPGSAQTTSQHQQEHRQQQDDSSRIHRFLLSQSFIHQAWCLEREKESLPWTAPQHVLLWTQDRRKLPRSRSAPESDSFGIQCDLSGTPRRSGPELCAMRLDIENFERWLKADIESLLRLCPSGARTPLGLWPGVDQRVRRCSSKC